MTYRTARWSLRLDSLGSFIAPTLVFDSPRRGSTDEAAGARAARRVVLMRSKRVAAMHHVDEVMVLTGASGVREDSGPGCQSPVAAEQHPTWRIQLLCYNRLLVPYLRSLVKGHPTVSVDTFGKFVYGHGLRVSLSDEETSALDVQRARAKAFPVVDALLVDEWQDFFPSWDRPPHRDVVPRAWRNSASGRPQAGSLSRW